MNFYIAWEQIQLLIIRYSTMKHYYYMYFSRQLVYVSGLGSWSCWRICD